MPDSPTKTLQGQTALVTGASGGIGRAIVRALASRGAACLVHAHQHRASAEEAASAITAQGGQALVVTADIAAVRGRETLVDDAWSWRNGVDIWVNNAGADILSGEAGHWPFERKLAELWNVDVQATMLLCREVGRRMQQRGSGVLINVGWDQAEFGMAGESGELYAAAKGAVMAFSRSLARSLAPMVRVNCVAPGWIKTAWGQEASDYWQRRAAGEALLGRWGTPDDVAASVAFLAGPDAAFLTGLCLPVNGGFAGPYHEPHPGR